MASAVPHLCELRPAVTHTFDMQEHHLIVVPPLLIKACEMMPSTPESKLRRLLKSLIMVLFHTSYKMTLTGHLQFTSSKNLLSGFPVLKFLAVDLFKCRMNFQCASHLKWHIWLLFSEPIEALWSSRVWKAHWPPACGLCSINKAALLSASCPSFYSLSHPSQPQCNPFFASSLLLLLRPLFSISTGRSSRSSRATWPVDPEPSLGFLHW